MSGPATEAGGELVASRLHCTTDRASQGHVGGPRAGPGDARAPAAPRSSCCHARRKSPRAPRRRRAVSRGRAVVRPARYST
jgi:hypothetical protein